MGLIVDQSDGMNGALVFTRPAFNTLLQIDRFWPLTHPLIHLARTNLNAVAAAVAGLLVKLRIHGPLLPEGMKRGGTNIPGFLYNRPTTGLNGLYLFYLWHLLFQYPFYALLQCHL